MCVLRARTSHYVPSLMDDDSNLQMKLGRQSACQPRMESVTLQRPRERGPQMSSNTRTSRSTIRPVHLAGPYPQERPCQVPCGPTTSIRVPRGSRVTTCPPKSPQLAVPRQDALGSEFGGDAVPTGLEASGVADAKDGPPAVSDAGVATSTGMKELSVTAAGTEGSASRVGLEESASRVKDRRMASATDLRLSLTTTSLHRPQTSGPRRVP